MIRALILIARGYGLLAATAADRALNWLAPLKLPATPPTGTADRPGRGASTSQPRPPAGPTPQRIDRTKIAVSGHRPYLVHYGYLPVIQCVGPDGRHCCAFGDMDAWAAHVDGAYAAALN